MILKKKATNIKENAGPRARLGDPRMPILGVLRADYAAPQTTTQTEIKNGELISYAIAYSKPLIINELKTALSIT